MRTTGKLYQTLDTANFDDASELSSKLRGYVRAVLACLPVMPALLSPMLIILPACADKTPPHRKTETARKPENAAQARKEIQTVYDQQCLALVNKNVNAFLALCTSDYQDIKIGNQVRPAGMIRQSLPQTLTRYSAFKMTTAIKTFEFKGTRATATATRHIDVTLLPKYAGKKAVHRSDTVTQDVWVKTPKGWRTKSSKEIDYKKL